MNYTSKKHLVYWPLIILLLFFFGCRSASTGPMLAPTVAETEMLLSYLEANGDIVNSPTIPHMVQAEEVFGKLTGANQLIIDVRPAQAFAEGHISHAVNVQPENILDYFEKLIEPNSFERIVFVCDHGMYSGYVVAVLEYLGYNNLAFLRYGLSSWNMDIAKSNWLAAGSAHMEGKLDTTPYPKPQPTSLPALATGKNAGYDILRARAAEVLKATEDMIVVSADSVINNTASFFIANYWPKDLYDQGHIATSVHYSPKSSLKSTQDLKTLPHDKPIVLYCYTGHHSNYPVAFLRLLGYDAKHVPYGTNAFIRQTMIDTQPPSRSFNENMVKNYPFGQTDEGSMQPQVEIKTEVITVQGGC